MLVIEDAAGFICHYEVMAKSVLDQDVVVPAMTKLQKRLGGKIERASFDRAFHTPANQEQLAQIVLHPCIAKKGQALGRQQQEEATVEFRQARQHHPGVELADSSPRRRAMASSAAVTRASRATTATLAWAS